MSIDEELRAIRRRVQGVTIAVAILAAGLLLSTCARMIKEKGEHDAHTCFTATSVLGAESCVKSCLTTRDPRGCVEAASFYGSAWVDLSQGEGKPIAMPPRNPARARALWAHACMLGDDRACEESRGP